MRTLLALLVTAPAALAAEAPADPFAGYWKPVSVEFDGQMQLDAKAGAPMTLVVKMGEYRVYYAADAAKDLHYRLFGAQLAFDPAAKTFELTVTDGQKKGEKRHGVFERAGDRLSLCYAPADKPRPTAFAAPAGSGIFHEVWTLEKPAK